ncbi:hypothetical protein RFI_03963 [Reticulomyxa filosa]|uniref:Uncharacterized protein n=1 Tax=Reticulomyxa filosa TaxID=46433 RepID=X6P3M6_RETFI|nr:hypothetical protein RFI_03963 [Reticulomyxa filosa]|eukprot:ETO33145.1 hypothetical protein RFI_03963 [Reticulomyxa filosa]
MKDLKDHLDKSCNLITIKQNIPYEITDQLNVMTGQIRELQNVIKDLQLQLQSEKVQTEQLKHLKVESSKKDEQIFALTKDIQQLKTEIVDLKQQQNGQIEQWKITFGVDVTKLEELVKINNRRIDNLKHKLQGKDQTITALTNDIQQLKIRNIEFETKFDNYVNEFKTYKQVIETKLDGQSANILTQIENEEIEKENVEEKDIEEEDIEEEEEIEEDTKEEEEDIQEEEENIEEEEDIQEEEESIEEEEETIEEEDYDYQDENKYEEDYDYQDENKDYDSEKKRQEEDITKFNNKWKNMLSFIQNSNLRNGVDFLLVTENEQTIYLKNCEWNNYNFGIFLLGENITLTVDCENFGHLKIKTSHLWIKHSSSEIDCSELGYPQNQGPGKGKTDQWGNSGGGGGYGTRGRSKRKGGGMYGEETLLKQIHFGSGGSGNGVGGSGGGIIELIIGQQLINHGEIHSNGGDGVDVKGGGGSGGSILIKMKSQSQSYQNTLEQTFGTIICFGGNQEFDNKGGDGRIAIHGIQLSAHDTKDIDPKPFNTI